MNVITTVLTLGLLCTQTWAAADLLKGTISETLDAGQYTYVHIAATDGDHWAAVPKATLKKGDKIAIQVNMVMDKFESPSLHRSFNGIAFGTLAAAVATQNIEKGAGADARRIAEIYAQKASLKGKTVTLRGKVVKYNAQIMGINWLHLRDGSGTSAGKDDDIAVTSQDTATLGDVVTVSGIVTLNKDIGAGYFFPVLIENARISKH